MSLIYLSFPFVLAAAATATNGSHLLPPLRPHRLLQVCPGTGDCSACVTVSNCVWCADAGYCSSSGTCISGGPARTCPSAPSASSVAWPHAGALGLFGVGVAATAALAVFTFSSSVQTSGALVWHPPTHKQRADVRLLFLGSSALWLGASLAAASPLLPWLVAATRSASDLGFTAFTYYECSTVSTPGRNSRLCVTIPTVSFVDQSLQSLCVRFVNHRAEVSLSSSPAPSHFQRCAPVLARRRCVGGIHGGCHVWVSFPRSGHYVACHVSHAAARDPWHPPLLPGVLASVPRNSTTSCLGWVAYVDRLVVGVAVHLRTHVVALLDDIYRVRFKRAVWGGVRKRVNPPHSPPGAQTFPCRLLLCPAPS